MAPLNVQVVPSILPANMAAIPVDTRVAVSRPRDQLQRDLKPTSVQVLGPVRGMVSVERLLALRDYTERTSTVRAVVICLAMPMPALVLVLAIECIPLVSPSEPWEKQDGFWVRLTITAFLVVFFSGVAFKKQIPHHPIPVSLARIGAVAALASALYVIGAIGISACWTFPIPFLFVTGSVVLMASEALATVALVNISAVMATIKDVRPQLTAINSISSAIPILMWVYPLYSVAFRSVGKRYQLPMLLFLPIFKFLFKRHMFSKLAAVEDLIPTLMMFTIELFNALCLATCMQSAASPMTTAVIIIIDVSFGLFRGSRVRSRSTLVLSKFERGKRCSCDLFRLFDELLSQVLARSNSEIPQGIRIRGNGIVHQLSERTESTLRALEDTRGRIQESQITAPVVQTTTTSQKDVDETLVQTLQLLFECESMMLNEFFECAVPFLYGVYLPILRALPNGTFFGHIEALTQTGLANALLNISGYWLLESLSLALLIVWLRYHFRFSPFHLLASVLDEHMVFVQCYVIVQMLVALQFTIAHAGESVFVTMADMSTCSLIAGLYCDRRGRFLFPVCLDQRSDSKVVDQRVRYSKELELARRVIEKPFFSTES